MAAASTASARWRRRLKRAAAALLVLLFSVALGGWWGARRWLRASAPRIEGEVRLAGLTSAVDVVRDRYGVPTITATAETDAFFALGFSHAQDRFFQMEMARRVPAGRVAELVGARAVKLDRRMRRFGLYAAAEKSFASLEPRTQAALTAYAAGVNAWLDEGAQRLPPEYDLLHLLGGPARPEPWQPADSIVILKFLSLLLDGNYTDELAHDQLVAQVGEARAKRLEAPAAPWGDATDIIPDATPPAAPAAEHGARDLTDEERELRSLVATLGGGRGVGSNSWVIGGARTKSGRPLLSNDPHLAVQSPSQWYAAHLRAPALDVEGATIPGMPFVVVGRNARIAWGITALHADVQDLYAEKIDPADPSSYLVEGKREPFVTRREQIKVAGAASVELEVRATRHGPIIVDDQKGHGPVALSWIALADDDTSLDALFGFDRAKDWAEFSNAARRVVAPVVNFTYADVDGHIAYLAPGRVPIRGGAEGEAIADGSRADAVWKGWVPFDELPRVVDPPEGFIVSANQRPVGASYPHYLGNGWAAPFRAKRIRELLTEHDKLADEDLPRLHADLQSTLAKRLLPRLRGASASEPVAAAALERIRAWDGTLAPDSAAAMIYERWMIRLMERVFADDLDADTREAAVGEDELLTALESPDDEWCDDRRTPARESCATQLSASLTDAVAELVRQQGNDLASWRLDRVQRVRWLPRVVDSVPILAGAYRREAPVGGDGTTVRVAHHDDGFRVIAISTFFGDYDLRPGGGARMAVALGQSAHLFSPHYDDLIDPWRRSTAPPLDPPEPGREAKLHLVPR